MILTVFLLNLSAGSLLRKRALTPNTIPELDLSLLDQTSCTGVLSRERIDVSLRTPTGRPVKIRGVTLGFFRDDASTVASDLSMSGQEALTVEECTEGALRNFQASNSFDACGSLTGLSECDQTDREESPVSLSEYFVSRHESVWELTSELISLLTNLHEAGIAVKPRPEDIVISLTPSDARVLLSASDDTTENSSITNQITSLLIGLRDVVAMSGDSEGFLPTVQACIDSLSRGSPVNIPSWIARFSKGPLEPLPHRLALALEKCDRAQFPSVVACPPHGRTFTAKGYSEPISFPMSGMESVETNDGRIFWSTCGRFVMRMPHSMSVGAARTICKERAFLTELAVEGIAVETPLEIITSDYVPGCNERVFIQESPHLLTESIFKAQGDIQALSTCMKMLDTMMTLHKNGIILGSVNPSMFSIDNGGLAGCSWCQSIYGRVAVQPALVDSDEEDEEPNDPAELMNQDTRDFLTMMRMNPAMRGLAGSLVGQSATEAMGQLVHAKREMEGHSVMVSESATASSESSMAREMMYLVEQREFAGCMEQIESDLPLPSPEMCWSNTEAMTLSLSTGVEVHFALTPLNTGSAAKAYLSSDESVVVKVLKQRPLSGADLCRERATLKALARGGVGSIVKAVDVDWAKSGIRLACQSLILVMENGGRNPLSKLSTDSAGWAKIGARMTQILEAVHVAGYLHADTNLGNFVYSNTDDIAGSLQLIDFGLSSRLYEGNTLVLGNPRDILIISRTRIKDVFLALLLASSNATDRNPIDGDSAISRAVSTLRGVGDNVVTRDGEPPYADLISLLDMH